MYNNTMYCVVSWTVFVLKKYEHFLCLQYKVLQNVSYCQGTEPSGEVKYFGKYSLTALPVKLPLVPTALIPSRGYSYKVS